MSEAPEQDSGDEKAESDVSESGHPEAGGRDRAEDVVDEMKDAEESGEAGEKPADGAD